ncbi:MAG: hypothetical protein R3A48_24400 [Polyangiales bacterium]
MSDPTSSPVTALLAPVPTEVLASLTKRDRHFANDEVITGTGTYNALASHEPGPSHDDDGPEVSAALALSREAAAPVYVVSFDWDYPRITRCRAGVVEDDDDENPRDLVRKLGLGAMLPPVLPDPRAFMFVEGATTAEIVGATGGDSAPLRETLRLESRGGGVLGWIERKSLDLIPSIVSAQLGRRVYLSLEDAESFAVLVIENGEEVGTFETPRTVFSQGSDPVDSILGETTREGILRAMGVDDSMNPQR